MGINNLSEDIRLKVDKLSFNYNEKRIIEDIALNVKKGEFIGLIGPNGSGKSTLLKNIYRALTPNQGNIWLDQEDLLGISYKSMAKKLGVMGQENYSPFDFTVRDMVAMGRNPHKKLFQGDTEADRRIVDESIAKVGLGQLKDAYYKELSGGEKQRVIIARVLAQQTDFLILDEPTNHLDISYQFATFELVKSLGVTVLSAIHDLNIAAMYCDRIYVLKAGRVFAQGTPEEIFTADLIRDVYGIESEIRCHPLTGKVDISFIPASLQNK